MSDQPENEVGITSASSVAKDLLKSSIHELRETALTKMEKPGDIFFPEGVELIYIKVKVATAVEVELKVAGAKGVQDLLSHGLSD